MPDADDQFEMAYAFGETNKDDEVFPLHPELIAQEQKKDRMLMTSVQWNKQSYKTCTIEDSKLITYNNKIVIPYTLRQRVVAWYHEGCDNGSKYKAMFNQMKKNCWMKKWRSTEDNPQSNGIVECVHQALGDMLQTFELE